jgi:tetratricopeptide (TPR) repeat protein
MDDETRCDDKTSPTVASPAPSDAHPFTNDAQKPQGSASLAKGSSHSSYNVLKRLGCPSKKSRNGPASVSDLSQRSGLLQTIVNSFRRHDQDQFKSSTTQEATLQLDSQNVQQGVTTLPSEKEFHLAVDATQFVGPVGLIHVKRTSSWDSDISSITVRMEEFRSTLDSKQELWWGATAGGFGRWFPTVVTTAVEAAEGFLSARAIHSQKKRTPLFEYQSSGDSEDEHESVAVANFPLKQQLTHLEEPHVVKDLRGSKSGMRGASSTGVLNGSGVQSLYSADVRRADEVASQIRRYNELIMEQESRYGKQDLQLATSLFALAVLHSQEGAAPGMEAAIECATEALRIQNERGAAHAALRSIHFLADLHVHQKQFDSSLTLYMEALLMEYNQFGDTSDEAAKTLNCIGTVHSLQNAFSRAMESHQEALRILQNSHGDNLKHPLISATLCHIGSVYYRERNSFSQSKPYADSYTTFIEAGMLETIGRAHEDRGSYKMAISFFEERLLVLESGGPASDPEKLDEVAETLNSLGMLSSRAGRFAQAIDYYEKGLKVQSTLGCDAVQLATVRVLIGAAHFQLGNWHRALRFYEESLDVLLRDLGREHETVAATLYHIGIVHASFYHLDKAMLSLSDAVQIQLRLLGPKHPATLRSRREIGNLFAVSLSRRDAALEVFDEVLLIQRTIHGDRHPNIAETLSSIGLAYARRGDYASALQILEETYHMRAEFLGNDVPSQASILYEISLIHLRRKHFKRALRICDVVLAIREESLRDKHIDTALTICLKGSCFAAQNKLDEADVLLANAVEMAVATVGDWHPTVAEIHVARSSLHLRRCHFDLSRECVERALEIYEKANLNDDFQPYVEAKQQLTRIEHDEALFV